MIPNLHPPNITIGWSSPFCRDDSKRQLRLTFHSSTLKSVPPEEQPALEALYELSAQSDIRPLQTGKGIFPNIEIGQFSTEADSVPVTVDHRNGTQTYTYAWTRGLLDEATILVGGGMVGSPDSLAMLDDLLIVEAHRSLKQDILVTTSPWLLERRHKSAIRAANPRRPSEAARILGLFLRSRDHYVYRIGDSPLNNYWYHFLLARHRLPNMWRFFSACVYAEEFRNDGTLDIGENILQRCRRALHARDTIGSLFYQTRPRETMAEIMYHFDYLPILLGGALDAQARIVYRAYGITNPKEWNVNFNAGSRSRSFLRFQQELLSHGASGLSKFIGTPDFLAFATLVYTIRNTIHAASPKDFMQEEDGLLSGYARLPLNEGQLIWRAATSLNTPEEWGLIKRTFRRGSETAPLEDEYIVEPYTYATKLAEETLKKINEIAGLADVPRLFPPGSPSPALTNSPPSTYPFQPAIRERLDVLG